MICVASMLGAYACRALTSLSLMHPISIAPPVPRARVHSCRGHRRSRRLPTAGSLPSLDRAHAALSQAPGSRGRSPLREPPLVPQCSRPEGRSCQSNFMAIGQCSERRSEPCPPQRSFQKVSRVSQALSFAIIFRPDESCPQLILSSSSSLVALVQYMVSSHRRGLCVQADSTRTDVSSHTQRGQECPAAPDADNGVQQSQARRGQWCPAVIPSAARSVQQHPARTDVSRSSSGEPGLGGHTARSRSGRSGITFRRQLSEPASWRPAEPATGVSGITPGACSVSHPLD